MSLLTQFAPFASGGGIKSIQTGYVASTMTSGSGEDTWYVDVTISSVTTSKAVPAVYGGSGVVGVGSAGAYFYATGDRTAILLARLTSATNLRISVAATGLGTQEIACRWYVIESN